MRKTITTKLLQLYLRSFPPITPNGNNLFGILKRNFLATMIDLINGGNEKALIMAEKILDEWIEQSVT